MDNLYSPWYNHKHAHIIVRVIEHAKEHQSSWLLLNEKDYLWPIKNIDIETGLVDQYSSVLSLIEEKLEHYITDSVWECIIGHKDFTIRTVAINVYVVVCGLMIFDTIHLIDADPEEVRLLSKFDMMDAYIFYIAALAFSHSKSLI